MLTASSGGGTRPLREWEPVAGASLYSVVVYDADGEAYWATITDNSATFVGGLNSCSKIDPVRESPRAAHGR